MGEIKSAFEKAMEKAERIGKATPEELRRMEYVPKGSALAARFLQTTCDLKAELEQHDPEQRKYLLEGAEETFLRNITLPQNEAAKQTNARAIEGILVLKKDRAKARNVFGKIEQIFAYYTQTRQQAYTQYKSSFEAQLQGAKKNLQQQVRTRTNINNVEAYPQFQEEWRKALAQLNAQYEEALAQHKQELKAIR